MASKGKSDHYHREAPQPVDGDVARIQMDFMFVGAEGTFVDEPRANSTVLKVICKDDDNLSATEVRAKTDEYGVEMVLRCWSTYEAVEIKTDGGPSIVEIAGRVQARRDKTTTLAQTSVGGHQDWSGGTCEWNSASAVASVLPGCATAAVDHHSTNHTDGQAHCFPNVLQSDRECS